MTLELEHYGARYVCPELNVALSGRDGWVLEWWRDFDQYRRFVRPYQPRRCRDLRRWRDRFQPIVQQILDPESQSPPLPPAERHRLLSRSALGRDLLAVSALVTGGVRATRIHSSRSAGGLLFFNGLREVDLRCRDLVTIFRLCWPADRMAEMCLGGSAMLARALLRSIEAYGGEVRPAVSWRESGAGGPRRGGRIANGRSGGGSSGHRVGFESSADVLELIERQNLPTAWRQQAAAFRYNLLAPLFALNLNLREAPRYAATDSHPDLAEALMVIVGIEDASPFDDIVQHHERGTIPPHGDVGQLPDAVRSQPGSRWAATRPSCGRSCPTACTAIPPTGNSSEIETCGNDD